jgi:hypothetical protein
VRRAPLTGEAQGDPAPIVASLEPGFALAPVAAREPSPVEPAPEAVAAPTHARDFLASYYGARWPEIRARMEAAGAPLDQPYVFRPWEEVAPQFESLVPMNQAQKDSSRRVVLRWPSELTDAWLQERVPIGRPFETSEDDRVAIEVLVEDLNGSLELLADEYVRQIDARLAERWRSGKFTRGPFTTMGLNGEQGFVSVSHGGHGWAMTITLHIEDCPEIAVIEQEASALQDQRDQRIREYLAGHCLR